MGLFSFFRRAPSRSALLLDITAASVAGAYVEFPSGGKPALHYTLRMPIVIRANESRDAALLRALDAFGERCVREGAPQLVRATGRGSVERVCVALDAPWQKTEMRVENVVRAESFDFTEAFVAGLLDNTRPPMDTNLLFDETIVSVALNGYATRRPYGTMPSRASLVVLTSLVDITWHEALMAKLRRIFHTDTFQWASGSALRYDGVRHVFPHEENCLIVDAGDAFTSLSFLHRGMLVARTEIEESDMQELADTIGNELGEFSGRFPAPQAIFVLAQGVKARSLHDHLATRLARSSSPPEEPAVIPLSIVQITQFIRQGPGAAPDLPLILMALAYGETLASERA